MNSNQLYCEGQERRKQEVERRLDARIIVHNNRAFISRYLNKDTDEVLAFTTEEDVEALAFKKKFGPPGGKERLQELKGDLLEMVEANRLINNIDSIIEKEGKPVNYNVFKFIVKRFGLYIGEEILKGYTFDMVAGLGRIVIKIKSRKPVATLKGELRLPINWGESNKLKKQIISEGGVPFDSNTAPNGKKWHIYYTEPYPFFHWARSGGYTNTNTKSRFFFKFKVCEGLIDRLNKLLREDDYAELNFERA